MALIIPVKGVHPVVPESCFVAENATIVGDVILGNNCSVWFNAVIRGDVNFIRIGHHSNVQDGAVIHCSYKTASTTVGNYVSIGHNALVHGCVIKDHVLIGMGAIVMDHALVEEYVIIAAGAIVLENTICESGFIYAGIPARKIKAISDKQKDMLNTLPHNYVMYSSWFD